MFSPHHGAPQRPVDIEMKVAWKVFHQGPGDGIFPASQGKYGVLY